MFINLFNFLKEQKNLFNFLKEQKIYSIFFDILIKSDFHPTTPLNDQINALDLSFYIKI